MAAPDLTKVFHNPGQLFLGPTSASLGVAAAYGGTAVGRVRRVRWAWGLSYERNRAEEWGEVTESRRVGEVPILVFLLDQRDDDMIPRVWPKTTGTGPARVDGGYGPGVVAALPPILFAPFDESKDAFYMRRPVPELEVQAALEASIREKSSWGVIACHGTRDSAWKSVPPWQVGKLSTLVLT
jgi:hypothetical protein